MGAFKKFKLDGAKIRKGGVYLNPGFTYGLEFEKVEEVETRDKGPMFVANFRILESNDPARKVGTSASFCQLLNKDVAGSNILELMVAGAGVDAEDDAAVADNDWDEFYDAAISKEQTLKGEKVRCITRAHKPRDAAEGVFITVHNWSPA